MSRLQLSAHAATSRFPRVSGDEPFSCMLIIPKTACFPRVSGDEPGDQIQTFLDALFSPRERG